MVASNQTQNNNIVLLSLVVINGLNPDPPNCRVLLLVLPSDLVLDAKQLTCVQRQHSDLVRVVPLLHQVNHKPDNDFSLFGVRLGHHTRYLVLGVQMMEE